MNTATFDQYDDGHYLQFTDPAIIHRDLEILNGIITGVACDKEINDMEMSGLTDWISHSKLHADNPLYRNIVEVLTEALSDGIVTKEESENIQWLCNQMLNKKNYYTVITGSIQQLLGILNGIVFDDKIKPAELSYLDRWLQDHDSLKNSWPYDELCSYITSVLEDGICTKEEHAELIKFCKSMVGKNESDSKNIENISLGFCQVDPRITILEHTFCITGISKKYKRREIAERIELYGGFVQNNVSKKLNYLVVCDGKNTCWAFSCYGRKVQAANQIRVQGIPLAIVHEYDLYDALADLE